MLYEHQSHTLAETFALFHGIKAPLVFTYDFKVQCLKLQHDHEAGTSGHKPSDPEELSNSYQGNLVESFYAFFKCTFIKCSILDYSVHYFNG